MFQFDATKACRVTVFLIAHEEIDGETGCSTYSLVQKEAPAISQEFGEGLAQTFSLEQAVTKQDTTDPAAACGWIDFGALSLNDVAYQNGSSDFPLIVALEVCERTWLSSDTTMMELCHSLDLLTDCPVAVV